MNIKILTLFLSSYTITISAIAANNLPTDLLYAGKPIDPLCIYQMESNVLTVALNNCGVQTDSNLKVTGHNNTLIKKGYIGYDYTWSSHHNLRAASYYKYIGKINNNYILQTLNNSGGTGNFSAIYLVKRQKDMLTVQTIAIGDRCNGGIENASVKNQTLTYKMNLTPYDLFDLARNNPHALNAYSDLAACAICCVATATMEREVTNKISEEKLKSIELGKTSPTQGKYEACFNRLLDAYKNKILRQTEIKQLVSQFNDQCFERK